MLKVLLFGYGSIGQRHARNLHALEPCKFYIWDPSPSVEPPTEDVLWKDPYSSRTLEDIVQRFLSDKGLVNDVHYAFICSPPRVHVEQALATLSARIPTFIEKPLCTTIEQPLFERLLGFSGLNERVARGEIPGPYVAVGCNYRFSRSLRAFKAYLSSLGKLYFVRSDFGYSLPKWRPHLDYRQTYSAQEDGGVVFDRIHEIDYLQWLFGPIVNLTGFVNRVSDLEICGEDIAEVALQFENGLMGSLHLDYLRPSYTCTLEAVGSLGSCSWTYPGVIKTILDNKTTTIDLHEDVNEMYIEELKAFLSPLNTDEFLTLCTLEQAKESLQVAQWIQAS